MRSAALVFLLAAAPAAALVAQAVPRRPGLPAAADTNSASAYYQFGVQRLLHDPPVAASAFYWASRLNPEHAEYPYARRVALIMADPAISNISRFGNHPRASEARALDSLLLRALILDPFLHRRLDDRLWIELAARGAGIPVSRIADERTFQRIMDNLVADYPEMAYIRGRYDSALASWGRGAKRDTNNAYLRLSRARAFYLTGRYDSARVMMTEALGVARRREATDSMRPYYESKASWEYGLGKILQRLDNPAGAREAFERSLVEDLSWFPSHIQLGLLHFERGDTAGGLRELRAAVESREQEYLPRVTYAYYLAATGSLDSASAQLRTAADLEPWAPQPRLNLGAIMDAQGNAAGALEAFEKFLARAPRDDPDRGAIQERVAALRAARRP